MRKEILVFFLSVLAIVQLAVAQDNSAGDPLCTDTGIITGQYRVFPAINGNTGLVMIPTGRFPLDKEIIFCIATNPARYHILPFKYKPVGEKLLSATFAFLPFMEITGTLVRPDNISKQNPDSIDTRWGIGDRSLKMRIKLLNERKIFPSMVFGIHDFFSGNYHQSAVYIAGSKMIKPVTAITVDIHLGYGFNVSKPPFPDTPLFSNGDNLPVSFLNGVFGGVSIIYKTLVYNIEYDCHKVNAGFSLLLLNHLGLQVSTLGFDRLSAGLSYRFIMGDPMIRKRLL